MVSKKVRIIDSTGLHLRPASVFCQTAMKFKSKISFNHKETVANAKSILSVLGACVKSNEEIEIVCEGEDENEALDALVLAAEMGFVKYDEENTSKEANE